MGEHVHGIFNEKPVKKQTNKQTTNQTNKQTKTKQNKKQTNKQTKNITSSSVSSGFNQNIVHSQTRILYTGIPIHMKASTMWGGGNRNFFYSHFYLEMCYFAFYWCNLFVKILLHHVIVTRGGRKSPIQFGNTDLSDHWTRLHVQLTDYRIIHKQNPFNIISRGVQGCTSTDFQLE